MIHFTVPLVPVSKGRPKARAFAGHVQVYTPAATRQAEAEFVALSDQYAPPVPFDGALSLWLTFMLPIPGGGWKAEACAAGARYPRGPKDVDNLVKLVMDAFNRSGRWWRNDAQVVDLHARKVYGTAPGTQVELDVLAEVESAKAWSAHALAGRPVEPRKRGEVATAACDTPTGHQTLSDAALEKARHLLQRELAHMAMAKAIKSGRLRRAAACVVCHKPCKVHGHHRDGYDLASRLKVIWVCPACHRVLECANAAAAAAVYAALKPENAYAKTYPSFAEERRAAQSAAAESNAIES